MGRLTRPGVYPYRKPNGRMSIAHVTRGGDGKLYATLLKHSGWRRPRTYPVGSMGGTWYPRIVVPKPNKTKR